MGAARETVREAEVLAWWALAAAAIFAGPLSLSAVGWLRERLRYGCWYIPEGDGAGTWSCGDGIVLLSAGVPMLALCGLALAAALLCLLVAGRAPRVLLPIAALTAGMPTVGTCLLLLASARATDASLALSTGRPPPQPALELWASSAGVAVGCVAVAAAAVAVATWLLVRGRAPRTRRGLSRAGIAVLLLSCIPTIGGTLSLAVVGVAIAFAVTRVAAAHGRELAASERADGEVRAPAASGGAGE